MRKLFGCAVVLLWLPVAAGAQSPASTDQRLKALEERILQLEAELRTLKAADRVPPARPALMPASLASPPGESPVAAEAVSPTPPQQTAPQGAIGGATGAGNLLNPSISVIGNFLGSVGKNDVRPVPAMEVSETELSLQAIIDPFARGDIFLAFGPDGVELEEGYLTFTALPGGLVARAGKMRSAFGKVNLLHTHNLPWVDRPLVTENLAGGEEGISDAGFSVSRILPAPKNIFLEATGQVFRGESEGVFEPAQKRDVSVVGHLRGYGDLSESTNLDLGFSYARGTNDTGSGFHTNLYGIDATLRWKPLRRAIYNSFLLRSELIWSNRDQTGGQQKAFGFYTAADYRLNRRWTLGGRFDRSGRPDDASMTDKGFSALLTYWPSEFSQIRGQYRFARYAEGLDGNEFRFQFLFVLGAHGAHPF